MSLICQDVLQVLEELAPRRLAAGWDNVGLLVGSPMQPVTSVVVALDVDSTVVDFALAQGANLIVAHHPVIFKPISSLRQDTPQGELLYRLIRHDIAVICCHTNLDAALGGVNDALAAALGLEQLRPLLGESEKLYKLAVFVPETHMTAVQAAMGNAGAGHIGGYSHCSFSAKGEGSFLPQDGAKPFIGEPGRLERVVEYKLETIVTESVRRQVLEAMLSAHPYEEVAYDLYELANTAAGWGFGRIGLRRLPAGVVKAAGNPDGLVRTVAVCGGSGAEFIKQAQQAEADVYLTGDVKYHEAQQAVAQGLAVVDAGHFGSEYPVVSQLTQYLSGWLKQRQSPATVLPAAAADIFWR